MTGVWVEKREIVGAESLCDAGSSTFGILIVVGELPNLVMGTGDGAIFIWGGVGWDGIFMLSAAG